ncbi:MAG: ABC transporter permease [Actinobacteria bacterium]|nr:ABC transporter permease [Actinomycetota bacterium]
MNLVRLIVEREYRARVRSKGWIIATVFGLIAIVGLNFAPTIADTVFGGRQVRIAVLDETAASMNASSGYLERLRADLVETLASGDPRYVVERASADREGMLAQVMSGAVDGFLLITEAGSQQAFKLTTLDTLGLAERSRLTSALSAARTFLDLEKRGIGGAEALALFRPVVLDTEVAGKGPDDGEIPGESWALTYVLVLLFYITLAIYGTYVAMGVIEEKSTRVVEIIISTVRPFQLMIGKVFGLGLAALTQYAVWVGAGFGLLAARGALSGLEVGAVSLRFADIDPWLLVAFAGMFALGFFSFAGLFAAGGSLVSRTEDAGQITGPITMVLVVVLFLAVYSMDNPESTGAVVLSMVPMTSPLIMFVRIAMGDPPAWQIVVSCVVSLTTILVLVWMAAKVFRAGILLYGRRMSVRAVVKAFR